MKSWKNWGEKENKKKRSRGKREKGEIKLGHKEKCRINREQFWVFWFEENKWMQKNKHFSKNKRKFRQKRSHQSFYKKTGRHLCL